MLGLVGRRLAVEKSYLAVIVLNSMSAVVPAHVSFVVHVALVLVVVLSIEGRMHSLRGMVDVVERVVVVHAILDVFM